ncbi:MAG: MmgE/PrpD family protein [Proteobacteria bacterium]|nr:MmgE/PrpD family protein [Burkholderiales bacterium]
MKQAQAGEAISPLMSALASYIAATPRRALPSEVVERAKLHLLDTLAAMVSGAPLLPGRRAIDYVTALGGNPEATIVTTGVRTNVVNAALANGMLAHADETDDAYYLALVHPGCSVVPAALAMAERERSTGRELLRAIVLGYDLCTRISKALGIEHFRSAGHSTHSFGGTFGAAAAAGALVRIDQRQARHMLSYAAQQASGLSCWARDVEHVEKAFDFGGMPARNGVTAASMVAAGFTGVEDVFSGDRGFLHAFAPFARPRELVALLGSRYEIMHTAIKRWPVGYPIQAPLDALATLIERHRIEAREVERVRITVDEQGARTVSGRQMADINLQYLTAIMLLEGDISFEASHDPARLRDPQAAALKARVELVGSRELSKAKTTQAIVEITLARAQGRSKSTVVRHHTRAVLGSATRPMTRADLERKCLPLLEPGLGARRARGLIDAVWRIDRLDDVRGLRRFLAVSAAR